MVTQTIHCHLSALSSESVNVILLGKEEFINIVTYDKLKGRVFWSKLSHLVEPNLVGIFSNLAQETNREIQQV